MGVKTNFVPDFCKFYKNCHLKYNSIWKGVVSKMITISSLSQFDFYHNFTLIAGEGGLFNPISNVVILEYESMLQDYSGFTEGNFVLTSLFFAERKPELIEEAFRNLIARGISGIAVKTAYYDTIPEAAVLLAKEHQIPLFLFHDVYMEDIIVSVNRLHEWSERSEYYEEQIHDLLNPRHSANAGLLLLEQMNPDFKQYLTALYLEPLKPMQTERMYNQIIYRKNKLADAKRIFIIRYYTGFLFLFHYESACTSFQAKSFMMQVLEELSLADNTNGYALCEIPHLAKELKTLLSKCFYVDVCRRLEGERQCCYEDIGIHQMLLPAVFSPMTNNIFQEKLRLLQEYDKSKKGYLLDTLTAYVEQNMQINAAADVLFQHPNTVRYRLEKAKKLLRLDSDHAFTIAAAYIVELYKISNLTIPYPLL